MLVVVDGGALKALLLPGSSHDEFHDGMKPFQAAMPVHPDDEYIDYSGKKKRKKKKRALLISLYAV